MLIKLKQALRQMICPGQRLVCAVSGGADSMALLFGAYLLKEELGFSLEAAHFNHGLRGEESDREEAFVRDFCHRFDILCHLGRGNVEAGKKGLEAAARDARYGFFATLPGVIATAHTADDNAETVLMHLVRGTGLKGLGGIAPVRGRIIRPMLDITRQEVEAFLAEYHVRFCTDSSNLTDDFLRNRLRHQVMPLLKAENPSLAENVSAMARRLRQDEQALSRLAEFEALPPVSQLRQLESALRLRMLERFLKENGLREPEAAHILLAEKLVFSEKPSASARFPGGLTVARYYDRLEAHREQKVLQSRVLPQNGTLELPELGLRVHCGPADREEHSPTVFTVAPEGELCLRSRQSGDEMRLSGGTKSLKKLFIDRKIPALQRPLIPVIADGRGVLAVYGIGVNLDRKATPPALRIQFERIEET